MGPYPIPPWSLLVTDVGLILCFHACQPSQRPSPRSSFSAFLFRQRGAHYFLFQNAKKICPILDVRPSLILFPQKVSTWREFLNRD
ncbi:hypothetical protein C8R43DRAFT_972597 [Mycena crocata]|nr:hypothetical protein C8R43DRAFT_972597 [Mycena crocata]